MKNILLALLLAVSTLTSAFGQKFSTYWHQRTSLFYLMPTGPNKTIFIGDSITDGGEWAAFFGSPNILNMGISGDVSKGVLARIDAVIRIKPKQVFLMIGINDLSGGIAEDSIATNIGLIVEKLKRESPKTNIYVQSILPVNDSFGMFAGHTSKSRQIVATNTLLQKLCEEQKVEYIDLYHHFVEANSDRLNPIYTNDGLHLVGAGYQCWIKLLARYIES